MFRAYRRRRTDNPTWDPRQPAAHRGATVGDDPHHACGQSEPAFENIPSNTDSNQLMIPDHFTIQFGENFTNAAQQIQSRFRKAAIVETGCTGEAKTHNLVQPISDSETTGERIAATVMQELETQKRWIRPQTFDLATGEPFWDEIMLAPTILPGGKHLEAHLGAYNRRVDKVFIDGLFGTNRKGKDGIDAADLPTENIVPLDFVPSGTAADSSLTVDKIIRAKKILTKNEAYGDDARARGISLWGAMTPDMEETLLFLANASGVNSGAANRLFSKDFLPPTLDKDGNISFFLGVNWIRSTQLPAETVGGKNVQYAGVWTSDAVHLDFWKEIQTSVDRRADLKNAAQFFSQYGLGACRSEDKKVVKITCLA